MRRNRRPSCIVPSAGPALLKSIGASFSVDPFASRTEAQRYIDLSADPSAYSCFRDFFGDYLFCELLSKFPNFDLGVDREAVAIGKFLEAERCCAETNGRLSRFWSETQKFSDPTLSIFWAARRKVETLLKDFTWEEAQQFFSFGPGAAIGVPRREGDSWYKFGSEEPSTTEGCLAIAAGYISTCPTWNLMLTHLGALPSPRISVVRGNKVTTVPKNAKTDRVIAIEPLLNMFLQKGIGGLIRQRLKKVGINLDDQRRNQELAREGSITGCLATIDLSSASDSISWRLVELMVPPSWFAAIEATRSPVGVLPDGTEIEYQKVSSMGNGFTFELESLIFWALCSAVVDHLGVGKTLSVYGDDIIVPSEAVGEVLRVLSFAGFTPNPKKTFSSGPFRESCGKHYFQGFDVSPIYIKESVDTLERKFWLANSIKRVAHRFLGFSYGMDCRFRDTYDLVIKSIPGEYRRLSIPDGIGDGGLVRDFDEATPPSAGNCIEGWKYWYVRRQYKRLPIDGIPALLRQLHSMERRPVAGTPRGEKHLCIPTQVFRLRTVKGVTARWAGLGPWLEFRYGA